jgi:hypothetical protein
MRTVWIYVDTNHYVGHPDHLKVFATPEAADEWFKKNDPEGTAFGYEVMECETGPARGDDAGRGSETPAG